MPTGPSTTVLKAFAVLEHFRDHPVMTTAQCAELLGIPRPTAHRLLVTLREAGAVEQTTGGHYRLSMKLFELGSFAPLRRRMGDHAHVPIRKLAEETGLPVSLAIRENEHILYLDSVPGRRGRSLDRVGSRGPIHATALGKVLMAHAPDDVLVEVVRRGLHRFTPFTITTPRELLEELGRVGAQGYAEEREECLRGGAGLAVPIPNRRGTVLAAMSITGPPIVIERGKVWLLETMKRTAVAITRGFDWQASLEMTLQLEEPDDLETGA